MKILIIRNFPTFLDVKRQSYNIQELGLAKALVKKGHVCDLVFWTDKPDCNVSVPCEGGRVNVFYRRGRNILKNGIFFTDVEPLAEEYDVVQLNGYNQYQTWKLAKKLHPKAVVLNGSYYSKFNIRYNLISIPNDLLYMGRYKRLKTPFMVKSELAAQHMIDKGISPENISVVYIGLDESALSGGKTDDAPEFVRRVEELDCPTILCVGSIDKRKNTLLLLDVLSKINVSVPDARLVLVGRGGKEYTDEVKKRIHELGLEDKVLHCDKLEQRHLARLYKKADIFMLPTEYEIYGMVFLEAMYFGVPVITTVNGGSLSLIENGKNGIRLEGRDIDEWAGAAVELLNNPDKRSEMGKNASETIKQHFTWDSVSENYLKVFEEIRG